MSNNILAKRDRFVLEHISVKKRFIFAAYFGDGINVEILSQRFFFSDVSPYMRFGDCEGTIFDFLHFQPLAKSE